MTNMRCIDIITLSLSVLGIYDLILSLRLLLPRHAIPCAAAVLGEAQRLLDYAETVCAIPHGSEYRATLVNFENQFLRMRTESHRSPAMYQQLLRTLRSGLTYRLYVLSSRIDAIKVKLELAMDERQLASIITDQSATTTALPDNTHCCSLP